MLLWTHTFPTGLGACHGALAAGPRQLPLAPGWPCDGPSERGSCYAATPVEHSSRRSRGPTEATCSVPFDLGARRVRISASCGAQGPGRRLFWPCAPPCRMPTKTPIQPGPSEWRRPVESGDAAALPPAAKCPSQTGVRILRGGSGSVRRMVTRRLSGGQRGRAAGRSGRQRPPLKADPLSGH